MKFSFSESTLGGRGDEEGWRNEKRTKSEETYQQMVFSINVQLPYSHFLQREINYITTNVFESSVRVHYIQCCYLIEKQMRNYLMLPCWPVCWWAYRLINWAYMYVSICICEGDRKQWQIRVEDNMVHINLPEEHLERASVLARKQIDQMSRLASTAVCHLTPHIRSPMLLRMAGPHTRPWCRVVWTQRNGSNCNVLTPRRPKHTGGRSEWKRSYTYLNGNYLNIWMVIIQGS